MDYNKELEAIVGVLKREGASDLHLLAGNVPVVRVSGNLIPLAKRAVFSSEDLMGFLKEFVSEEQVRDFLEKKELDFSYDFRKQIRFRGNVFYQRGLVGIALRVVSSTTKTLKELKLPPILETFARKKQGFFLVVGSVGQGKSTTLASMIEIINTEKSAHILTIEDPIEYLFKSKKSIINQREVSIDTKSFTSALKTAFRQDVDVLMIGEMRGIETMSIAVTAAETGHLVLSTLHTNNAAQAIDRIIDSFPAEQQGQIRTQLAGSLVGIFSQRLIPRISGGLIPAYELLINNNAVASLIREGKSHEINLMIETGSRYGMVEMNRSLADLVQRGEITQDNAFLHSLDTSSLMRLL